MKRCFLVFLSVLFVFSVSFTAYSAENFSDDYIEYLELIEKGVLGEDVTYSQWHEMIESSKMNIDAINESNFFKLIYAGTARGLNNITLEAGDVILTNDPSTASGGTVGHAGIVVGTNNVLHIEGTGFTPSYISFNAWLNKYNDGYTYIYRCNDFSAGVRAAAWGISNYGATDAPYHNASYSINHDIMSFNPTYCSKIVWQCYYFGAGASYAEVPVSLLIAPFDLPYRIETLSIYEVL